MHVFRFSVFTATYNRENFIINVYNSLVQQTFKDFEWILIDDGSSDNTEILVNNLILKNELLSIRYIKKVNGGKHTAWREATKIFNSEYVITIDSDDYLTPNALEIFNKYWKEIELSDEYSIFWEVKARAKYESGIMIEKPLPAKVFDAYAIEFSYKYKFTGDLHGCRKTSVLKNEAKVPDNFLFEEKCSNFSENIRWFRAGKKFKTRYIEEFTEIVIPNADNKLSSSSKNRNVKLIFNNIIAAKYHLEENKKEMLKYWKSLYFKTIIILLYNCFRVKINPLKIVNNSSLFDIFFLTFFYIPSYILFLIRK